MAQAALMAALRTYVAQTIRVYRSPRTWICLQEIEHVGMQNLDAALGTDIVTEAMEVVWVAASAAEDQDSEPCVPYEDDNVFAAGTTSAEH